MSDAVVVTAKGFSRAKSRLAGALDAEQRSALARDMFEHVLGAVRACPDIARILVATDCDEVADRARQLGADALMDPPDADSLGPIVDAALDHLREQRVQRAVVLMSDLPRLGPDDVRCMFEVLDTHDAGLAPDRASEGTNGLSLHLTPRRTTCFGHTDSRRRHEAALRELGASVEQVLRPGLAFDVDDVEDVDALDDAARS